MIVVKTIPEIEESLVPAVVKLGDDHRTAHRGVEIMIFEIRVLKVRDALLEILPVDPGLHDNPLFGRHVQLVGPTFGDDVERSARSMARFGRNSS